MARHSVTFEHPSLKIGKADFKFHVRKDGSKFGILKVSKGAVVFVPQHGGKNKERKIGWSELATYILESGRKTH